MPLLARLMVIWLSTQKKSGISDEQTYSYLTRKRIANKNKDPMNSYLGMNNYLIFPAVYFICFIRLS
jgi:hypothetical protein